MGSVTTNKINMKKLDLELRLAIVKGMVGDYATLVAENHGIDKEQLSVILVEIAGHLRKQND